VLEITEPVMPSFFLFFFSFWIKETYIKSLEKKNEIEKHIGESHPPKCNPNLYSVWFLP